VGRKKNFEAFLEKYIKPKPGPIIEIESGRVIGEHKGTHNYTLGKRVTVDEKIFPNHEGLFVIKCDTENNTIYAVSLKYAILILFL
jgi:tRNA-specific 2-thiouridylase